MNWRFWRRADRADEGCAAIEPLLSLYSDGMSSSSEARRIEAHLETCPACRQALSWMEATRSVIAARPVVPPPADLRARIARAIAEAETASAPPVKAPDLPVRRPMTLRPALAYGLPVAAFAALAGGLFWSAHQPPQAQVANNPASHPPAVSVSPWRVPTAQPGVSVSHPHANVSRPVIARAVRPDIIKTVPHPVILHRHPTPETLAYNQVDTSQDEPSTAIPPVASPKKSIAPAVRHPKPPAVKTPGDMARMARNVPSEHPRVIPPKPTVAPATHDDHVAMNNAASAPEHPYVPEPPHPVQVQIEDVHPPLIQHDTTEVHEASAMDVVRGNIQRMRRDPISIGTMARTVSTGGVHASAASDQPGIMSLVESEIH